jgi:tetratricopeptide (TPR) repeat protein
VASNPRIDDLRKRLEKEPGSRLFAQLAEELRKAGELDEAISISRDGLQRHGAYPSARMTLGRALFDKGDLAAARGELESVLKGAPDNILASRLLAECLESLGDLPGAAERFRKTLAMAPGDRQMAGKVAALDLRIEGTARARAVPQPLPPEPAPEPSEAPIPLVAADEPFELERPYEAPLAQPGAPWEPTLGSPDVEVSEPEVVANDEPVADMVSMQADPAPLYEVEPAPAPPSSPPEDLFEFDAPFETADGAHVADTPEIEPELEFREEPPQLVPAVADRLPAPPASPDFIPQPPRMLPQSDEEPPPPWVTPAAVEAPAPELISSTLAELYFNQGFTTKAIEVYRQLLDREPENERATARLRELEEQVRAPAQGVSGPAGPSSSTGTVALPSSERALRRQAIENVIGRLEGMRAALRRG